MHLRPARITHLSTTTTLANVEVYDLLGLIYRSNYRVFSYFKLEFFADFDIVSRLHEQDFQIDQDRPRARN